jgi:hypothetical protein
MAGDVVIHMFGQPWVEHPRNGWMPLEEFGDT